MQQAVTRILACATVFFAAIACGGDVPQVEPLVPQHSSPASAADTLNQPDPFADSTRFVRSDSNGVPMVTSLDSLWRDDGWWVDTTDVILSIGVALGDTTYELHGVKNAVRTPDGGIAIAESSEAGTWIKIFDSSGQYRRRIGMRGAGPGEFTTIGDLAAFNVDSTMAYDFIENRITVFNGQGRIATVRNLPLVSSSSYGSVRRLTTGTLIGAQTNVYPGPSGAAPYFYRNFVSIFRIDTLSNSAALVFTLPGSGFLRIGDVDLPQPFSSLVAWTTIADQIVVASSENMQIVHYDTAGYPLRMVRVPVLRREMDPDTVAAVRERWRSDLALGGARAVYARANLDHMQLPATIPVFSRVMADSAGNYWLRKPQSQDHFVIDRLGRLLGTVHVPANRRVREVGSNWVLVSRTDQLGVEFVEVLRIVKGDSYIPAR